MAFAVYVNYNKKIIISFPESDDSGSFKTYKEHIEKYVVKWYNIENLGKGCNNTMKYDVFISYRRNGGEYTAKVLNDKLSELGYNVFFDVESLRNGDFNIKLYSVIDECCDFILILSPGALDRCNDENDWVRREIEYALEKGKNIIPIMLRGFSFPTELPASIECVRFKNGIEANTSFFDAFIEKLQEFLSTKPITAKLKKLKPIIVTAIAVLLVCGIGVGMFFVFKPDNISSHEEPPVVTDGIYPGTNEEKNLTGRVVYNVQINLQKLDVLAKEALAAFDAAEKYIQAPNKDLELMYKLMEESLNQIMMVNETESALDEDLIAKMESSTFEIVKFTAMNEQVGQYKNDYIDYIASLIDLCVDESKSDNYKLSELSYYKNVVKYQIDAFSYAVNDMLLPITNQEILNDFFEKTRPVLDVIDINPQNWSQDKESLKAEIDSRFDKAHIEIKKIESLIDYKNEIAALAYPATQEETEEAVDVMNMVCSYSWIFNDVMQAIHIEDNSAYEIEIDSLVSEFNSITTEYLNEDFFDSIKETPFGKVEIKDYLNELGMLLNVCDSYPINTFDKYVNTGIFSIKMKQIWLNMEKDILDLFNCRVSSIVMQITDKTFREEMLKYLTDEVDCIYDDNTSSSEAEECKERIINNYHEFMSLFNQMFDEKDKLDKAIEREVKSSKIKLK